MSKTNYLNRWSIVVTRSDILFLASLSMGVCLGLLFLLVNQFAGNYPVMNLNHGLLDKMAIIVLEVYIASYFIAHRFPRVGLAMKVLGMVFAVQYLGNFLASCMTVTPFHLHDSFFQRIDHWMGFDLVSALHCVAHYPWLERAIRYIYNSLEIAILLVIVTLTILQERKQLYRYMAVLVISLLIGATIYYLVPTTSPQSVIHNFKFMPDQLFVLKQFNAVHHHATFIPSPTAGIVGFPSFHTIWPILMLYAVWNNRMVRWVALIYAILVPISAVLIGWHFLIDIIGGIMVAGLSIILTEYLFRGVKETD